MSYIISSVIGYLLGNIQAGYIIGRLIYKKDIRELGNGNSGASNGVVVFGRKVGILIGIIDILKAVVAVIIVRQLYQDMELLYLTGLMVILGHNFPFYMHFKGGKGTASLLGFMFALDYKLGIIAFLVTLVVAFVSNYIVIGTMSMLVCLAIYTLIYQFSPISMISVLIIILMSIYKHYPNFDKIKDKTEVKVRDAMLKKRS